MLDFCTPIPSRLPPDLIRSPETLITGSCIGSPPLTTPLVQNSPAVAPDLSAMPMVDDGEKEEDQSELKRESRDREVENEGQKEDRSEQKQDSDECYAEKILEEQDSHGDRSVLAVENDDQKEEPLELKQDFDVRDTENVLEEDESNDGGEKVPEEFDELKKGFEEIREPAVRASEVDEEDGETTPSISPIRPINLLRKYSKPAARQIRHDPYSFKGSSDFDRSSVFDEEYSDTGPHMHHHPSRPAPPPPPSVGAGLGNMGNTCFLNAVMQCFTHTVPLALGLRCYDCGFPKHHNGGEFCVLLAVRDHVTHALAAGGEVIFPENLVNNLSCISSFFQRFQQEDAHEYLQCLLDKIDTCWSKCKGDGNGVSSQGDSPVKQVFGGRLVSQLHCCNCGSRSDTYEPLVDLSLEIEDADDLNGALKSFTKMEEIEDEVKFTCEKCKEQVPLKKQLLIDQAPCVATLHLKRFKGDGYFVEKIDKALEYPLELDLKPYTVVAEDENVDLKYELYAVIVHTGFSSTSGHYLCYIRSSPGRWFEIDDSKVTEVGEETALSQQGYILFYAKKGTPWPCSLVKSSSDNGILSTSPKSVLDILEDTQHSSPRNACFYNPNAAEVSTVMEMEASTKPEHPYQHAFDEACRITDDMASDDLATIPNNEFNKEGLITAWNTQHSNGLNPCLYNQDSVAGNTVMEIKASTEHELPFRQALNETCKITDKVSLDERSTIPKNEVSIEELIAAAGNSSSLSGVPKDNEAEANASFSQHTKPRSLEYHPHPEVAVSPRPAKKVKVESSATPRNASRSITISDRKRKEALKSMRRSPSHRRELLSAYVVSCGEGSMGKNKKWL